MILGIFSTFSRGAFLGLSVFAFTFWKSSDRKVLWLVFIIIIIGFLINIMPEDWLNRMDTVEHAESDGSFMGRVISWKIAILIAMDNVLGGGFKAVENMSVWGYYALDFDKLDFIKTPDVLSHYKATHSIYFQVLSNHGFIGLFLFLLMLMTAYVKLIRIIKVAIKNNLDNWIIDLSKMLKLSIIAFSVSGAAVNVAFFEFLYAIFAMTVALQINVNNEKT